MTVASIGDQKCPDGAVCITIADQLVLWHREADMDRMHEILQGCPGIHFGEIAGTKETVVPTSGR